MFDINKISRNPVTEQFTCSCNAGSSTKAKNIQAHYLMSVNERFNFTAEIGVKGSIVTIASNSPDITKQIANIINTNYFMPPLDVYVFYGSSQKGLESRWCVGFDCPQDQVTQIIDWLNTRIRLANADKDPMSWHDKNGTSYSVVMLTGIMDQEQSDKLENSVNFCLSAIQDVTARKLSVHAIQ